ncbi:MAG: hypothetical protein ACT4TC_22915 [Myxococcaceae bacterium]
MTSVPLSTVLGRIDSVTPDQTYLHTGLANVTSPKFTTDLATAKQNAKQVVEAHAGGQDSLDERAIQDAFDDVTDQADAAAIERGEADGGLRGGSNIGAIRNRALARESVLRSVANFFQNALEVGSELS